MTRDYKNARSRREKRPCWIWGLLGLLIGGGVGYALQLQRPAEPSLAEAPVAEEEPVPVKQAPEQQLRQRAKEDDSDKRRYEFYTLLPEMELVLPEEPAGKAAPKPTLPPAVKPPAPAPKPGATPQELLFVLQAGSFLQPKEAEGMKANLALLGVQSAVQPVMVGDEVWHRVFIGPYKDPAYVDQLQQHLRRNQISTLIVKTQR
jgi:cell division protein FtsN